jgi:hypothetical protein
VAAGGEGEREPRDEAGGREHEGDLAHRGKTAGDAGRIRHLGRHASRTAPSGWNAPGFVDAVSVRLVLSIVSVVAPSWLRDGGAEDGLPPSQRAP